MRWMTGHVELPIGANVLGLLEFLSSAAIFIASLSFLGPISTRLANGVILIAVFLIAGFDILWRYRETDPPGKWRYFSPFSGGCFFFIPIWLFYPAAIAATGIAIIVMRQ